MTISGGSLKEQFVGAGSTGPFTITDLQIQDDDQVLVTLTVNATGVETTLTKTTDYSVNTALTEVTTVVAVAVGETLTCTLNVPSTQGIDYKNTGTFDAEVNEDGLDKLTLLHRQQQEQLSRAVKFPVSSTQTSVEFPLPSTGKGLIWAASGDLENSDDDINGIVSAAAASAAAAAASETAAGISETNAAASESAASTSESNAATSETNAAASETAAGLSETAAEAAQTAAETAETNAETAETNAETAQTAAELAETNAAASEAAAALSAAKLQGTSTTSLAIETGAKVFTTQADKFFTAGTWLLITSDADPTNYMHGQVTTYSGTTLTMNVTNTGGSGTLADWTITVAGTRGAAGQDGTSGFQASDIGNQATGTLALDDEFVWKDVTGAWELGSASLKSDALDVSSEDILPQEIDISPDGTRLYVIGGTNSTLYEYDLSVPFDLSTGVLIDSFSIASQGTGTFSFELKPDGSGFFAIGDSNTSVYQYTMSTVYDLTTASYDSKSFDYSSETSSARGITFNATGTKMYVACITDDKIYQYALSTPWDVSTASYDSKFIDVTAAGADTAGIRLGDSGTVMMLIGNTSDKAYQWDLSVADDISSATYSGNSVDIATDLSETKLNAIGTKSDGSELYVAGNDTVQVRAYSLGQGLKKSTTQSIVNKAWLKSADVASATALPIPVDGNYADVTGTTTITSIATTGVIGKMLRYHFDGILTLTHHATDLILPGGANITTAAGDEMTVIEYASGDYRVVNYQRAAGIAVSDLADGTDGELITWGADAAPAVVAAGTSGQVLTSNGAGAAPTFQAASGGGTWNLLQTQVASASATIDFTSDIDSTYAAYKIIISGLRPATDVTQLQCRTGNGGSFDSGASDYYWGYANKLGTSTLNGQGSLADSKILMMADMGNDTTENVNVELTLYNPSDASQYTQLEWSLVGLTDQAGNGQQVTLGGGTRIEAAIVDRIQFLTSSGNIAEGRFTLYGISHS